MSSQRASVRQTGTGRTGPDHHVRRRRDAALERTRSITRTVAVASVGAVAVFALYVSRAVPGHAATTGTTAGSTSGVNTGGGSPASQYPSNLATPSSPPVQQQQQQAPVVSGSS